MKPAPAKNAPLTAVEEEADVVVTVVVAAAVAAVVTAVVEVVAADVVIAAIAVTVVDSAGNCQRAQLGRIRFSVPFVSAGTDLAKAIQHQRPWHCHRAV